MSLKSSLTLEILEHEQWVLWSVIRLLYRSILSHQIHSRIPIRENHIHASFHMDTLRAEVPISRVIAWTGCASDVGQIPSVARKFRSTGGIGIGVYPVGTFAEIWRPRRPQRFSFENAIEEWFDGGDAAADDYKRDLCSVNGRN